MYEDWSLGGKLPSASQRPSRLLGTRTETWLVTEKVGEWTGKGAVVLNESTVEVRESQESLEFLDGGRFGPGLDSFHLPLVHPDAATVNMIT